MALCSGWFGVLGAFQGMWCKAGVDLRRSQQLLVWGHADGVMCDVWPLSPRYLPSPLYGATSWIWLNCELSHHSPILTLYANVDWTVCSSKATGLYGMQLLQLLVHGSGSHNIAASAMHYPIGLIHPIELVCITELINTHNMFLLHAVLYLFFPPTHHIIDTSWISLQWHPITTCYIHITSHYIILHTCGLPHTGSLPCPHNAV